MGESQALRGLISVGGPGRDCGWRASIQHPRIVRCIFPAYKGGGLPDSPPPALSQGRDSYGGRPEPAAGSNSYNLNLTPRATVRSNARYVVG